MPTESFSLQHTVPVVGASGLRMTVLTSPMEGSGRYALTKKVSYGDERIKRTYRIKTFPYVTEFAPDTVIVLPPDDQGSIWTERARESLAAIPGDAITKLRFVTARRVSTNCTDNTNIFGMKMNKSFDCKLVEN
ncbi:hypothetical protein [Breoghania sp.]|uniref:hypothetical protein n=1 Tax=Breoghania sp. TaxID=2065378 RepID=UPI00262A381F|nr:hypothetical protein [Breoghania sp.]MDJ0931385.1 hypothetical protein [Breoghania sp.]